MRISSCEISNDSKVVVFFIIVVYSAHVLGSHDIHAMSALILVYELSSHIDAIPAYLTC